MDYLSAILDSSKILRIVNGNDIVPHGGFPGLHPTNVTEYYYPPNSSTLIKCEGNRDMNCSSRVKCLDRTWADHSGLGLWSMRKEFCRFNTPVSNNIYE